MASMIWVFQVLMLYYLLIYFQPEFVDNSTRILRPDVGIPRILLGIILHYALTDYIALGLEMMKYAVNHPWKFHDVHTAFGSAASFCLINFVVEALNFNYLMQADNVLHCLWYFLGVAAVRSLGSYIYVTIRNSKEKDHITDPRYLRIFTIQTTTSTSACAKIPAHELAKDGICPDEALDEYPAYIRISFWERSCLIKFYYLIYRVMKAGYVTIWYYFAPLGAILLSYAFAIYAVYVEGAELVPDD